MHGGWTPQQAQPQGLQHCGDMAYGQQNRQPTTSHVTNTLCCHKLDLSHVLKRNTLLQEARASDHLTANRGGAACR